MTKISDYELITIPPALDDLLIGTDISGSDATKNFTIQSVVDLTPIPTLQEVTNSGNTTTVDLIVNSVKVGRGGGNISTNTANGVNTLQNNTTGYANTANGANALRDNISGVNNTAVGLGALQSNTNGYNNTANGVQSLYNNTTGYENVANGYATLYYNTTGFSNTANGFAALNHNTTGKQNTATGRDALYNNTTGSDNTANGYATLYWNTTGYSNTANGFAALYYNTTGKQNTATGRDALYNNTTGSDNTANGYAALYNNIGGTGNTAIGYYALNNNTGYSNSVGLGNAAQVTSDFQIQLGSGSTTCYTNGTVQNRSDLRDKAEVRDTVLGLDFISKLRPVDYKWDMREDYKTEMPSPLSEDSTEEEKDAHKIIMDEWLESVKLDNITHDGTHTRNRYHHGLIAQEVQDLGIDFGGFQDHKINGGQDVLSIGYDELIAPMIKAIQELKAEIELLKSK